MSVGNVIEINGKKYDAATGKLLNTKTAANASKPAAKSGVSVDGMVSKKPAARAVSSRAMHAAKNQTQKSKTLMRSAVKKPAKAKTTRPKTAVSIQKSHLGTTKQRQRTATQVKQSPLVSHFGSSPVERAGVVKKVQHMPVKKQAMHRPAATTAHHMPAHSTAAKVGRAASGATVKKKNLAAAKMIESALANATSHEQPAHKLPKRRHKIARKLGVSARAMAISSTVLAGVLLGGFFAVQNVPNLSMRVAAARAGFDATLPAYNPSGFSFQGPINYSPGQVKISFSSNTDDRSYELTQRASNWNSEALLSNYVATSGQQYQTYEDRGRTLYIYGGANATWVDNGIWYQVEGESRMTSDQLIRVAASM